MTKSIAVAFNDRNNEGGDVHKIEGYLPLEEITVGRQSTDPFIKVQSDIYARVLESADREVHIDELASIAAATDRNDVRNLAYGAAVALKNLDLIEFDSVRLTARMKT